MDSFFSRFNFTKSINTLFTIIFLFLPLLFFSKTSELFEFNKLIFVYIVTVLITAIWVAHSVIHKKFLFRRTSLDLPLLVFLLSQVVATIFSIEPRTSLLGYYSRWNGGLLSLLCYVLLYWAYVTWSDRVNTQRHVKALFISTAIVSVWGILEHFGRSPSCLLIYGKLDVSCWVQDVALRVFASFGQPNWMAAWLVAILPLSWVYAITDLKRRPQYLLLSGLIFIALLFTKSRSGLIAFVIADLVFWVVSSLRSRQTFRKTILSPLLLTQVSLLILTFVIGTPWTSSILGSPRVTEVTQVSAPALESGGTESGDIRRIVWTGAVNVWKRYPLTGSGVETFALSYYLGRPMEHNLTSEWNFLYNKAHNEYLNFLATTGILGLGGYILILSAILITFIKIFRQRVSKYNKKLTTNSSQILTNETSNLLVLALGAGFTSILITNFFGFSVVTTQVLLFLFPAIALCMYAPGVKEIKFSHLASAQKGQIIGILLIAGYALFSIQRYWMADYQYAQAVSLQNEDRGVEALSYVIAAIERTPNEPIYHDFLAQISASIALAAREQKDEEYVDALTNQATVSLDTTQKLAPNNIKLGKSRANVYADLSEIDSQYLLKIEETLLSIRNRAPTDPSIVYQQGLAYAKLGRIEIAIEKLELSIEMKPNYKSARRLLGLLYKEKGEKEKAREQFEYILKYISPDDTLIADELKVL